VTYLSGFNTKSNNTISDNVINNCSGGIECGGGYAGSGNNHVINNILSNNGIGIEVCSIQNIISDNVLINNGLIILYPWSFSNYHNSIMNNTVNGHPLMYLEKTSDINITTQVGQVILVDCENISITNQYIHNASSGINIWNSTNCSISNSLIEHNAYFFGGIFLSNTSGITMKNNTISDNQIGITQVKSQGNIIKRCNIKNSNITNIILIVSQNSTIQDNKLVTNGIYFLPSGFGIDETYNICYFNTHCIEGIKDFEF